MYSRVLELIIKTVAVRLKIRFRKIRIRKLKSLKRALKRKSRVNLKKQRKLRKIME